MKLAARMWLLGAFVPLLAFVAATLAGARFFKAELERDVDHALLMQVATEAVSLFDDDAGGPHLHLASSPLEPTIRRIEPEGALYRPDGGAILRYPNSRTLTDERLDVARIPLEPVLATRPGPSGDRVRVVTVAVVHPKDGQRYALQIAASLDDVDGSVGVFLQTGLAVSAALGLVLLAIQSAFARRLTRRVAALSRHMAALREGTLDAEPPRDAGDDEIAELSRVVADASARLRGAREAQDRLIAQAAHELRTPLQYMRTSLDLGLRGNRSREELAGALADARGEVDRLADLSTRLLDFATAERSKWDRAMGDVAKTARDAAEAIRAEAETRAMLVDVRAPEPVPASFDANGLRQAIDNLLSNAIRYGPAGTTVRVDVARSDGFARILVHDDGPGIPPEERERVFEPFERGKACAPGGAGLGLAIVREVARGHGGRAYVAEGPGGNVAIEIPARAA